MDETKEIKEVFGHFENAAADFELKALTSGHINRSYLINNNGKQFVMQSINTRIFKDAERLNQNILAVSKHLNDKKYPHRILNLLPFENGQYLFDSKWRIFDFMTDSQSFEKAQSSEQVFEAARFLSEFYLFLNDLNTEEIKDSIPGFLDFNQRFQQFEISLQSAGKERIKNAETEIGFVVDNQNILKNWNLVFEKFPKRIIHADPKISNFLFDQNSEQKIIALIDWDTLMCGPLLYDFGDMVRSYTNLTDEDDGISKNIFSYENYKALKRGFLFHLKDNLSEIETENLDLAAKVVIYIQAVRFLTDYLNEDVYYQISYPEQNLNRAKNQIRLLKELMEIIN